MRRSIRSRAPSASDTAVRTRMRAVSSASTAPELRLRKALHRLGYRYRVNARPVESIRCKADIVFSRRRVCVFVDGCFWHGCPDHFEIPRVNSAWWSEKVEDNRARDRTKTGMLESEGWTVVRLWEHEVTTDLKGCVEKFRRHFDRKPVTDFCD
jgi:DNA mismatch endonuclease (patch repair protein)